MRATRAEVFLQAARAIRDVYNSGMCSDEQRTEIINCRRLIRVMSVELLRENSGKHTLYYPNVLHAMQDVHRFEEYDCSEKLVRDLNDIGVTLYRLEHGGARKDAMKVAEATTFCQIMADELMKLL